MFLIYQGNPVLNNFVQMLQQKCNMQAEHVQQIYELVVQLTAQKSVNKYAQNYRSLVLKLFGAK